MKKIRRALNACLLLVLIGGTTLPSVADEAKVAEIRQTYQAIEDGTNWVKKTVKPDKEASDVTAITRYEAKDGALKKLVVKTSNDDGLGTERYYFSSGRVIFIFLETEILKHAWEIDKNGEQRSKGTPQKGMQESRMYYAHGKCVRYLFKEATGTTQAEAVAALAKTKNTASDDTHRPSIFYQRGMKLSEIQSPKK